MATSNLKLSKDRHFSKLTKAGKRAQPDPLSNREPNMISEIGRLMENDEQGVTHPKMNCSMRTAGKSIKSPSGRI
jgi:hypothetical protein